QPSPLPPQAASDPEGAGVGSTDPRGAASGGVGVGAESVPARGFGVGGAGVGVDHVSVEGSSLRGAGVCRVVTWGAITEGAGAPSAGPGEPGTGRVAAGGAGSGGGAIGALKSGAAGVGAREASVGVTAAKAAAAGAAVAGGAAGAVAAAAAGAAAAAAAVGATTRAAAAAAAASTSCLWPSGPWSPLPFSSLLPLSFCLRSHLALIASLPTHDTDSYHTYRPVLSRILASLATDPRASLSSVSALTATVTEFAATRCLDYATRVVDAPPTSPLAVRVGSAFGFDALEDRQFELEFLAASSPHLCAMLLAPEGDRDAFDIPTPRTYAEAPSSTDLSLFDRCGSTPFFVLVYVNDLLFATADTVALADVKSELQKRYTCIDLGELRHYLGLQITSDRAAHTITLNQSHMVQQVLQQFGFQFSIAQPSPLAIDHRLT
ncbi:unnamed protein product, partial [Closterium sp. NIES-54]